MGITYTFTSTRLIMILELFVIGVPSFFLSLQPNSDKIKGKFLTNLMVKALPAALIFTLMVISTYLLHITGLVTEVDYQTMASLCVTLAGVLVLFRLCKPFNAYRVALFCGMLVLVACAILINPVYAFLGYTKLSLQNVLFIIVFAQFAYPIYNTFVRFFESKLGKNER
jgi:cation-transporting ATPase E